MKLFLKLISNLKSIQKENLDQLNNILKTSTVLKNKFLKNLLVLNIYLKNNNKLMIKEIVDQILFLPYFYFINQPISYADSLSLKPIIEESFVLCKKYLSIDHYLLFKTHITFLFPKLFDYELSLNMHEFRKKSRSIGIGLEYAPIWINLFKKRMSIGELKKYIKIYFKKLYYLDTINSSYHLLAYLPLVPPIVQGKMKLHYQKLSKSKIIELLQIINNGNEIFIKRNILKVKKPFFIYQRDFYMNLILNGKAIDFSLYKLLKLGDLNIKYLLWLIK